jgi:hypothetical protein
MTLRKFFRKCRQLNLFMLVIIPNFFQLPLGYAISRSIFAIDIKFDDDLERGGYDFYGFKAKKKLFIRGRKYHDYNVQIPDFSGEFFDGYGVPEKAYRDAKRLDMLKYDEDDKVISPREIECSAKREVLAKIYEGLKDKITQDDLAAALSLNRRTINDWIHKYRKAFPKKMSGNEAGGDAYNNLQDNKPSVVGEGEEGQ